MDRYTRENLMKSNKVDLVPIDTEFTERVLVSGMVLPSGLQVVSFKPCSPSLWAEFEKTLQGKTFTVAGARSITLDPDTIKMIGRR